MENLKKKNLKKFLKQYIKMDKNIKFDDTEIEKYNFLQNKSPILIGNVDINKIVVSNEVFFGKKDFQFVIDY